MQATRKFDPQPMCKPSQAIAPKQTKSIRNTAKRQSMSVLFTPKTQPKMPHCTMKKLAEIFVILAGSFNQTIANALFYTTND
ncbi:hypothetical protein [Thalassospira sp. MIT1370]|uniref:hypothetical protein n=1 Tax=unclassified Thalassospira TaxID=2648997 RepID=UPI00399B46DF